jgi:hypothetical protein
MTERKRAFEPGQMVVAFTGQAGMVLSAGVFADISNRLREGKRPGHYFAPGCCHNPDYVTQVPVLFEDGTYDVMRAMNIRKAKEPMDRQRERIQRLIENRDE